MNQNIVKTYTYKGYGEVNIEECDTYEGRKVYYAYFEDGTPAVMAAFHHLPTRDEVFLRINDI